jgi:MoaA/NifB/PqqE/SkfB family radical SAM enzyme
MGLQERRSKSRKDGDWWTIYGINNGNRLTFSFKDNPEKFDPMPMLVDMKITDFCDKGCSFCYMDSKPDGKHALNVNRYLFNLSKIGVFEIALGGGEPTKHPKFMEILNRCHYYGIKPNFSTKSLEWIENDSYKEILKVCGAFGYSVSSLQDVVEISNLFKEKEDGILSDKIVLQIIPALFKPEELYEILSKYHTIGYNVLLLGYKDVGRGKNFDYSVNEKHWLDVVKYIYKDKKWLSISIDTSLANRYNEMIEDADIDQRLYHIKDGKYSCYIDAVNNKIGPSSYEPDKLIDCGPYELEECMYIITEGQNV